jgi:hypothetical protein
LIGGARIAGAAFDDYDKSPFKFNAMIGKGSVGYNQSLHVTPATAAGVTGKLWSLTNMVQVIEDWGSGERAGEDHRGNADGVKGETTYVGSRGPRGKRTDGIFHHRLLKRTNVFCQGKEIIAIMRHEKGGNWVYHCVKPE